MFKNILRIQVEEAFLAHVKGRPRLLGFDDEIFYRSFAPGCDGVTSAPSVSRISQSSKQCTCGSMLVSFATHTNAFFDCIAGNASPRYCCVKSSFVKKIYGVDCGRNPTDRGRLATTLSAAVDDMGVPYSPL